jgi:two-component system CheB/CheR fusion protein
MRPQWREKYFHGKERLRINRDVRSLVIFGRSNLAEDAPISRVNLLVCRNVLIYFDSKLQKHILARLHYGLDPGGVLFLGKSESQLANSSQFRRINARWRIFQRITGPAALEHFTDLREVNMDRNDHAPARPRHDLEILRQQHKLLLETMRVGVLTLDAGDVIVQHNAFVLSLCGLVPADVTGKRISETDIVSRIQDLPRQLQTTRRNHESVNFSARMKVAGEDKLLHVSVRPLMSEAGERTGTLVYLEDQTVQEKLQSTVEELEATSEELQSANEELETTNEELQSTNEELETTNEELQSTNEELETTNEELQSLNEELETTNQELEERTKELDQVNNVYSQTLEKMHQPILLVNQERHIEFWNQMALRLFGFKSKPPMDLNVEQLPLSRELKALLIRRHRAVLLQDRPMVARKQFLGNRVGSTADIHFSVIRREDRTKNVLIVFETNDGVRPKTGSKNSKPSSKKKKSEKTGGGH